MTGVQFFRGFRLQQCLLVLLWVSFAKNKAVWDASVTHRQKQLSGSVFSVLISKKINFLFEFDLTNFL